MRQLTRYLDFLFKKKRAYANVFDKSKEETKIVLADLRSLCPTDPTKNSGKQINDKKVYINIGRRQILSHIMNMLQLTDEDIMLMAKYSQRENGNVRLGTDESGE